MIIDWTTKENLSNLATEKIENVGIVLDIGCGIKPQNYILPRVHICCEPFEEYRNVLQNIATQQTDRNFVVLNCDWREAIKVFPPKSVDTIFLLDVVEHLDKEEGEELLRITESISRRQIIIFTPLGYMPQEHPDGIDAWGLNGGSWQEHKSGWLPQDFDDSWHIFACKEFHFADHNGKPFDTPYGAFWAIKSINKDTYNCKQTNVLCVVQSFIPKEMEDKYLPILKNTINSIKDQKIGKEIKVSLVLSDDGSEYLHKYINIDCDEDIRYLNQAEIAEINRLLNTNLDKIIVSRKSDCFRKASLFNFCLKDETNKYDLAIFLDDDHCFVRKDSITRFVQHYRNGYSFIVGRLYLQKHGFYDFNFGVQGTTYALSYSALKTLNFFNELVVEWGFGEDIDIFHRAYLASQKSRISAIFDSNIITEDMISGRWLACMNKVGGKEIGEKKFKELYGISMEESSTEKNKWMTIIQNDLCFDEKLFRRLNIIDYNILINGNYIQKKNIVVKIIVKNFVLRVRSIVASILRRILGKEYFVRFKTFFGIQGY